MLDRALPPLAYNFLFPMVSIQEAFAYCYLASYSDQALQPRVFTSFQRAYGVGQIELHAPVIDGRPGYLLASYVQGDDQRMIVAIEGMRTASQVRTFWNDNAGRNFPANDGPAAVLTKFFTHGWTIYNELKANGTFMAMFNRPMTPITFTGFSLGSACAELVGEWLKRDRPTKALNVVKF